MAGDTLDRVPVYITGLNYITYAQTSMLIWTEGRNLSTQRKPPKLKENTRTHPHGGIWRCLGGCEKWENLFRKLLSDPRSLFIQTWASCHSLYRHDLNNDKHKTQTDHFSLSKKTCHAIASRHSYRQQQLESWTWPQTTWPWVISHSHCLEQHWRHYFQSFHQLQL